MLADQADGVVAPAAVADDLVPLLSERLDQVESQPRGVITRPRPKLE